MLETIILVVVIVIGIVLTIGIYFLISIINKRRKVKKDNLVFGATNLVEKESLLNSLENVPKQVDTTSVLEETSTKSVENNVRNINTDINEQINPFNVDLTDAKNRTKNGKIDDSGINVNENNTFFK